jgi:hypothetical protein
MEAMERDDSALVALRVIREIVLPELELSKESLIHTEAQTW